MKLEGYSVPGNILPDIITVSHLHIDHNNIGAVSGEPVVLQGMTGPLNNGLKQNFVFIDTTINDVRIYSVESNHNKPGISPILNAIFVFEFDGIRVAHLGDLGVILTEKQLVEIGKINVLMIPVGGKYTLSLEEADQVVKQINPAQIVFPIHFRTRNALFLPNSAEDFLNNKQNVRKISSNQFILKPDSPLQTLHYILPDYKKIEK